MEYGKLTKEEAMSYIKLYAEANCESAGFDRETIDEAIDKMVKLRVRPKRGGYAVKVTVKFDVSLMELYSVRKGMEELQELIEQ